MHPQKRPVDMLDIVFGITDGVLSLNLITQTVMNGIAVVSE